VFDRLQTVSQEIQSLAPVFLGAKVVSVAHTGLNVPNATRLLAQLPAPFQLLETVGEGAIVSVLENGDHSFLVVVNRDFKKPMKLILYTDDTVKRVLKNGAVIPVKEFTNATEVDPGDLVVYMFPGQ